MKKFVCGFIVGILLASTLLFSFGAMNEIKAVLGDFNFVVNGKKITLQNQPIVVNGATYLPVREVAELLGYEVTYAHGSKTIIMNAKDFSEWNGEKLKEEIDPSLKEETISINKSATINGFEIKLNTLTYTKESNQTQGKSNGFYILIDAEVWGNSRQPIFNGMATDQSFASWVVYDTGETSALLLRRIDQHQSNLSQKQMKPFRYEGFVNGTVHNRIQSVVFETKNERVEIKVD